MASYNAEPYIEAAIRSALSQEGVAVEVVIVDDASTDRTADIAETLARKDDRVRLLRQRENAGPAAARNLALAQAKGEWIAVLDADDAIEPERTTHLLDLADATAADIVADNLIPFDDVTGHELPAALARGPSDYVFVVTPADYMRSNILLGRGFALGYLKPMVRSSLLSRHPIRYDSTVHLGEDFLFCLEALFLGARYVVSTQPYYRYRMKRGSQSHRLSLAHVDQLARGFENLIVRAHVHGDVEDAVAAYRHGLDRAKAYLTMIDRLQHHAYSESLQAAAMQPDIWPLIARFGVEFARKRLNRLNAASTPR
jgi:succinoglycan biosynthesis protein ExoO